MADTAAHVIDSVLPVIPVRQWVLSLPFALRYRMAYDSRLMSDVLNIFVRAVLDSLRRRARESYGLRPSQGGAVTFVQRFGDALNLNVHFHMLALDGHQKKEGGIFVIEVHSEKSQYTEIISFYKATFRREDARNPRLSPTTGVDG